MGLYGLTFDFARAKCPIFWSATSIDYILVTGDNLYSSALRGQLIPDAVLVSLSYLQFVKLLLPGPFQLANPYPKGEQILPSVSFCYGDGISSLNQCCCFNLKA